MRSTGDERGRSSAGTEGSREKDNAPIVGLWLSLDSMRELCGSAHSVSRWESPAGGTLESADKRAGVKSLAAWEMCSCCSFWWSANDGSRTLSSNSSVVKQIWLNSKEVDERIILNIQHISLADG